jgi:hypothetical protein
MPDPTNQRRFPRVNVGNDHSARFKLGEHAYNDLAVANLSAGGCCVKIPAVQAEKLEKGTQVAMLYLVHSRIPSVPLQATVCWMLGKQPGKTDGFVLIGFEFQNLSPQFLETMETYVNELLT